MSDNTKKASANPTKAFFVRMITRDITLEDSILDLVDNSIDAAWKAAGSQPMSLADDTDLSAYQISITVSPDQFSIVDNCGGMTLEDAINHAFSFGKPALEDYDQYSIGVYGIGMKRAAFKLGKEIRVRSTYQESAKTTSTFTVPIVVKDWLKSDDLPWDFDIVGDIDLDSNGVEIVARQLTQGAKISFENAAFVNNLRRIIARDYSLHLKRGLNISINNVVAQGVQIEFSQSDVFAPMRSNYNEKIEDSEVSVEIIGGMAALPPETLDPDEKEDGDKRFGWYVACNGRIVLAADKTDVSGWGTSDWPQWHRQYSGFIGIVLFTSANAAVLPLTTTKRSVDRTSEIFLRARPKMRAVSRQWIDYTNFRKQAIEEAKVKEKEVVTVSIHNVKERNSVAVPTLNSTQATKTRLANVHYSVPIPEIKKLATEFGSAIMPYREVGIRSFNYAYRDLVEDEYE